MIVFILTYPRSSSLTLILLSNINKYTITAWQCFQSDTGVTEALQVGHNTHVGI